MSNFEATKLYESVIEEVISDSRQDFEDSGIDESTLQELKKIWCQKLSQAGIAKFSWDEEAHREEEELARHHQREDELHLQYQGVPGAPPTSANDVNAAVNLSKTEPIGDLQIPGSGLVGGEDAGNSHSAGTTSSLIGGSSSNGGLELPIMTPDNVLSYNNTTSSVPGGIKVENDDNNGELMLPRIGQADGTIEFTMYTNEAERLMKKIQKQKKTNQKYSIKKIGQVDGNFDDDDDDDIFNDSDDINSDLDDDVESDREDDEDGQDEGQIMLCLYDKVQRVKNKWKSTLKEGVANINGKDYVFQKSNGESEW